jgi:hypothetical protein
LAAPAAAALSWRAGAKIAQRARPRTLNQKFLLRGPSLLFYVGQTFTAHVDALSVLLSVCDSEFKGRRKAGGGYAYYNTCPGRNFDLGRTFEIKGPNPTPVEQKYKVESVSAEGL